jgi:hypothetical protein
LLPSYAAEFDLLLDGSDNFDTRYLANETACGFGNAADFWGVKPMGGASCGV